MPTSFQNCDVSSWDDQATAFKEVFHRHGGQLDIFMASAGIAESDLSAAAYLTEEEEPMRPGLGVLDVNLLGRLTSSPLHEQGQANGGWERRLDRLYGFKYRLYPFPVAPLYGVSKARVVSLVRSLGPVLERVDIRINALAPAVLDTNIQPNKSFFEKTVVTPMSTLVVGFIDDPSLTGTVAEIHGDDVTFRPPHEYVDEDSRRMEVFSRLAFE